MPIVHTSASSNQAGGQKFVMVAGNAGNESGYSTAGPPNLGSLVPLAYEGRAVIRVAWGLSAQFISVGLFQAAPGDIGVGFWDTIEIETVDPNWNGHVIVEANSGTQSDFAGEFRWNALPGPVAAQPFILGTIYNLLWKP